MSKTMSALRFPLVLLVATPFLGGCGDRYSTLPVPGVPATEMPALDQSITSSSPEQAQRGMGNHTWFWTRAGQTIGMRAWRLRIQNADGSNIRITQALIRLATAAFGLGNLMCLFNRKAPRAFQDIWSECEVVVLGKQENLEMLNK